ncbi:glycoside hydrolase family 127 protein [Postechiella marina]|uniref:Glycoside hydrolase family 127 protein n=2 Tax=Postechiella marina TaxID=943941 RepID=A0ABP8CBV9_9FLAO
MLLFVIITLTDVAVWSQNNKIRDLSSNEFIPEGWVKEFLNRQVEGLGSHPEESGFPFNTGMWTENMKYTDREFEGGSDWWPYEQTGYYLDGILRCGQMTGSETLKNKVEQNLNSILKGVDNEGILHAGDIGLSREGWPMVVIIRMLIEKYEISGNTKLLSAIDKHYKAIFSRPEIFDSVNKGGFEIRPVLNIELLGHMYGITRDDWYVETAEKLYDAFQKKANQKGNKNYMISVKGMNEGVVPSGHAVTYHEFLKLPAILYKITGKEKYKTALYKAYKLLEETHELADGGTANHEGLAGKGSNESVEACSLIDSNWTTGWALLATEDPYFADKMEKVLYNASFSLITKDFKAYQYYQMPNLLISTNSSSFYNDHQGWGAQAKGRLCYRPGHDTECCAGNIHRMLPTFINRSCIVGENKVKVALYLPGTISTKLKKGAFSFSQETNYPFNHYIKITINEAPSSKVELGLRIPKWSDAYTIKLNGKSYVSGKDNTIFKSISRTFKKGDVLEIRFKTEPKIDDRNQGVAINYGPLVFSYPIESRVRKSTFDSGSKSSLEFPAYEHFPKDIKDSGWAIALSKDILANNIEVIQTNASGYPWEYNNVPIKLKVKAKHVTNWTLNNWTESAPYPENIITGKDLTIELYPEASTILRITEFPKGNF